MNELDISSLVEWLSAETDSVMLELRLNGVSRRINDHHCTECKGRPDELPPIDVCEDRINYHVCHDCGSIAFTHNVMGMQ